MTQLFSIIFIRSKTKLLASAALLSTFFVLLISLESCKESEEKVTTTEFKGLEYPSYFKTPHYLFTKNVLTAEGVSLGRDLFYDPILSLDSTISCGSCHTQTHGFADHNGSLSEGIQKRLGNRNAPSVFNLAWNTSFMWDGGINHLEIMPLAPITNPVEMDESIPNVLMKLNRHSGYKQKFKKVFGKEVIDDQMMFYALAQFQGTIVSASSKYDMMRQGKASFTSDEHAGYLLFQTNCAACHSEPMFTDYSFRNNGLDTIFKDAGRGKITLDSKDSGKFKVPSLRNVELTYPYMHDGRFFTLELALDHYITGIKASATRDDLLKNPIKLNASEKAQLIDFLKTLTDYEMMGNPLYSKP